MPVKHTDREYEAELGRLREQLLSMGASVEEMISKSVKALVERDTPLAHQMIEFDQEINRLEVDTDELCLKVLARRQPVASDLRFITLTMKMVTDLERIGDLGVNICERVIELNQEPPLKPYVDLPTMAETARSMVREALDAFVGRDADRAQLVIERDRIVDAYYGQTFRELLTYMMEDPRNIYRATRVQAIAKHLERIGDHATNLAEMVVFMVKGQDIRHVGRRDTSAASRVPHGVLFLCVHNAARSQMAEGLAQRLFPPGVRVWSAGSVPAAVVDPRAVEAMREIGIDITKQRPKAMSDVPLGDIDTVITLCAEEVCPAFSMPLCRESWALPDPADVKGGDEEVRKSFRQVRDALRRRIEAFVNERRGPEPVS
ncbi:MAG: phosphate signaling complex protein PhoU [Deltaproteobacteria bacterium]|nr:phosphate signaling complex protein PhoU [Deltaproteobacteria bacterium]